MKLKEEARAHGGCRTSEKKEKTRRSKRKVGKREYQTTRRHIPN
jgi:hypothetical protein